MNNNGCESKRNGFTLVELMVALIIGLLVVAGAIQIFLATKRTFDEVGKYSRVQESLSFISDVVSLDIRTAAARQDLASEGGVAVIAFGGDDEEGSPVSCGGASVYDGDLYEYYKAAGMALSDEELSGSDFVQGGMLVINYSDERVSDLYCSSYNEHPHLRQVRFFSELEDDVVSFKFCYVCSSSTDVPLNELAADEIEVGDVQVLDSSVGVVFAQEAGRRNVVSTEIGFLGADVVSGFGGELRFNFVTTVRNRFSEGTL